MGLEQQQLKARHAAQTTALLGELLGQRYGPTSEQRISEVFKQVVVSRDHQSLQLAESPRGRLTRWMQGYETPRKHIERVSRVVAEALKLSDQGLSPEQRIALIHYVRKQIEPEKIEAEPLSRLFAIFQTPEIKSPSLLSFALTFKKIFTRPLLEQLFGIQSKAKEYTDFVTDNVPSFSSDRATLVLQAQVKAAQGFEAMFPKGAQLNVERRRDLRVVEAGKIAEQISSLKAEESYLFEGRYGNPIKTLAELLELFEKLSQFFKEYHLLDEKSGAFGLQDEASRQVKQAQQSLHDAISDIQRSLPLDQAPLLHALFDDTDRKVPESLRGVLPEAAIRALEARLSKGVLGNIADLSWMRPSDDNLELMAFGTDVMADFEIPGHGPLLFIRFLLQSLPSKNQEIVINWVRKHGKSLTHHDPAIREAALKDLEKDLVALARMPIETIAAPLTQKVLEHFATLRDLVPPFFAKVTGIDSTIKMGPYLLHIVREAGAAKRFSVEIYCDHQGVSSFASDKIVWPKIYRHVPVEALNTEFFEYLLYQRYEPEIPGQKALSIDQILETVELLIVSNGGKLDRKSPSCHRSVIEKAGQELPLLFSYGTDGLPKLAELRFEALATFCLGHVKQDAIDFGKDKAIYDFVTTALRQVEKDLEQWGAHINPETLSRMQLALTEIAAALSKMKAVEPEASDASGDPLLLAKSLATHLRSIGITPDNFSIYGELLHEVLGPEMMEIVDLALDSVDKLPPEQVERPPLQPTREWLRDLIGQIYTRAALRLIQNLYYLYRVGTTPLYALYLYASNASLWERILPTCIQDFVATLQTALYRLRRLITAQVLKWVFRIATKGVDPKVLEAIKLSLQRSAQKALGKETISYTVPPARQAEFPLFPLREREVKIETKADTPARLQDFRFVEDLLIADTSVEDFFVSLIQEFRPAPFTPKQARADIFSNAYSARSLPLLKSIDLTKDAASLALHRRTVLETFVQLRRLPIPSNEETFWQSPAIDPERTLHLIQLILHQITYIVASHTFRLNQALVEFHLLAISEVLAKRIPGSQFGRYSIDATLLDHWMESDACLVFHPEDASYLKQIHHYFANRGEPTDRAHQLFHCDYLSTGTSAISQTRIPKADAQYLLELYQTNPAFYERALEKAIAPHYSKDSYPKGYTQEIDPLNLMNLLYQYDNEAIPLEYRVTRRLAQSVIHTLSQNSGDRGYEILVSPDGVVLHRRSESYWYNGQGNLVGYYWKGIMLSVGAISPILTVRTPVQIEGIEVFPFNISSGSIFDRLRSSYHPQIERRLFSASLYAQHSSKTSLYYQHSRTFSRFSSIDNFPEPQIFSDRKKWTAIPQDSVRLPLSSFNRARGIDLLAFSQHTQNRLARVVQMICDGESVFPEVISTALFRFRAIENQLRDSPRFIEKFAECFRRLIEANRFFEAYHLRAICLSCAPDSGFLFPVSSNYLTIGPPESYRDSPTRLRSKCFEVLALHLTTDTISCLTNSGYPEEYKYEIERLKAAWSPVALRLLSEEPEFRKHLALMLMTAAEKNDFDLPASNYRFDQIVNLLYVQSADGRMWTINFVTKMKRITDYKGDTVVSERVRIATKELPPSDRMQRAVRKQFVVDSECCEVLDDYLPPSADRHKPVWLMEPQSETVVKLSCSASPHMFLAELLPNGNYRMVDAAREIPTPLPAGVAQLKRFATEDQITCTQCEGVDHLHRITIADYNLEFVIERIGEELRAVETKQYPGFYIDPVQNHPLAHRFPSHLLLRNAQGERKLLLPDAQWFAGGLAYLREWIGPLVAAVPVSADRVNKIFCYTVSSAGKLQTTEPAALVYLLQLYLIQGLSSVNGVVEGGRTTIQLAEEAALQLASLCRQQPIDLSLQEKLLPLICLPDSFERYRNIHLLLTAAFEENRLLQHCKTAPRKPSLPKDPTTSVLLLGRVLYDLLVLARMTPTERRLMLGGGFSEDKEWFVYRSLFRQALPLVDLKNIVSQKVYEKMTPDRVEALIELLLLPQLLQQRYQQIKARYGIPDSLTKKVIGGALSIATGQSSSFELTRRFDAVFNWGRTALAQVERSLRLPEWVATDMRADLIKAARIYQNKVSFTDTELAELREAIQDIHPSIIGAHLFPLDVQTISPDHLRQKFLVYYAVVTGELGGGKSERMAKCLTLVEGRFDRGTNNLVKILLAAYRYRSFFPSVQTLYEALKQEPVYPVFSKVSPVFDLIPSRPSEWINRFDEIKMSLSELDESPTVVAFRLDMVKKSDEDPTWLSNIYFLYYLARNYPSFFQSAFGPRLQQFNRHAEDASTQINSILAAFLLAVADKPSSYLPSNEFVWHPLSLTPPKQFPKWFSVWEKLQSRAYRIASGTTTAKIIGHHSLALAAKGASSYAYHQIGGPIVKSILGWTPSLLQFAGARRAVATTDALIGGSQALSRDLESTRLVVDGHPHTEIGTPYQQLDGEDERIDLYLTFLFDLCFTEKRQEQESSLFGELSIPEDASDSIRWLGEQINQSLKDYARLKEAKTEYRLVNRENLATLYGMISEKILQLEATQKSEEERLLSIINPPHLVAKRGKIDLRQLIQFIVEGSFRDFSCELSLTSQEIQTLDFLVAKHLARKSRTDQFKRIQKNLEQLAQTDRVSHRASYYALIENIAEELKTRRCYSFAKITSPRLVLRLLCFEAYSNKLIWAKQLKPVQEALLGKKGDSVLELIMGMGKNAFAIPVADDFFAGEEGVVNIFPSSMIGTNIAQTAEAMGLYYQHDTNSIRFSRDHSVDPANLTALNILFRRSIERSETINMTREDAQAFKLKFLEVLYDYTQGNPASYHDIDATLIELRNLLLFLRQKVRVIGDEAHEEFSRHIEQCWPVGSHQILDPPTFKTVAKCLLYLVQTVGTGAETEFYRTLRKKKPILFDPTMAREVAQKFSEDPAIVDYLCQIETPCPPQLKEREDRPYLTLVRGVLTLLLPKTLALKPMVQFGAKETPFAAPFDGNMSQIDRSVFSNPDLTLVMTFIQLYITGLKDQDIVNIFKTLSRRAVIEAESRIIPLKKTETYLLLQRLFRGHNVEHFESPLSFLSHTELTQLRKDPKMIEVYVEIFALPKMRFWVDSIRSNSHDFASIFGSHLHDTGTPFNFGTYPIGLDMVHDPGTMGMALEIAQSRCPADGIRVLEKIKPRDVLEEVMQTYFADPKSSFMALIDGSALLKGMSTREVAQEMLEFIRDCRPDIKGVVFFEKDSSGLDQLYVWELGAHQPIPFKTSTLLPEERFSYYDDKHGFAADIPQARHAKAIDLVDREVKLYRLLQEIFRMRGLKFTQKLVSDGDESLADLQAQVQEVHYALTRGAAKKIEEMQGAREITFKDIATLALHNQAFMLEPDHYESHLDKVAHLKEQHFWKRLLGAATPKEMGRIFKTHRQLWIQEMERDPIKLYGEAVKTSAPQPVITKAEKQADALCRGEIAPVIATLPQYPHPKEVTVVREERQATVDRIATLAEHQQHEEQQQEQKIHARKAIIRSTAAPKLIQETPWATTINPYEAIWEGTMPRLWNITDHLSNPKALLDGKLSPCFDRRLWISDNALPQEDNTQLGSEGQRQLIYLLVKTTLSDEGLHFLSVHVLAASDYEFWREQLRKTQQLAHRDQKIFIYDTLNHTTLWGDEKYDLSKEKEFLKLVVQLKYLDGRTTDYTPEEMAALTSWLMENRSHIPLLRKALIQIHTERSGEEPLTHSPLDHLLESYGGIDLLISKVTPPLALQG